MATGTITTGSSATKRFNPLEWLFVGLAAVMLLGLGVTAVGLAGLAVVKGVDVLDAGRYFLVHRHDEQAFPAGAELCNGLFCRRHDTTPKHISGSPHHQSEKFASFCPEHERSDWLVFLDLSHLGSFLWYAYCAGSWVSAMVWAALAGGVACLVIGSPALLFLNADRRKAFFDGCIAWGVVCGFVVGGAAGIAYAWW